ncbi:MAG TPA: hypothetical protein IAC62_05230 [Candidatus Pelethocola excrementipullorum]|nr:hypothetical protein [Candidatus Pelethocola excrementipullorum]
MKTRKRRGSPAGASAAGHRGICSPCRKYLGENGTVLTDGFGITNSKSKMHRVSKPSGFGTNCIGSVNTAPFSP